MQVVGVLNTVNGGVEYCAKFRKYFGVPKPRARVANTLPKDYFLNLKKKGQVSFAAYQKSVPTGRSMLLDRIRYQLVISEKVLTDIAEIWMHCRWAWA